MYPRLGMMKKCGVRNAKVGIFVLTPILMLIVLIVMGQGILIKFHTKRYMSNEQ